MLYSCTFTQVFIQQEFRDCLTHHNGLLHHGGKEARISFKWMSIHLKLIRGSFTQLYNIIIIIIISLTTYHHNTSLSYNTSSRSLFSSMRHHIANWSLVVITSTPHHQLEHIVSHNKHIVPHRTYYIRLRPTTFSKVKYQKTR